MGARASAGRQVPAARWRQLGLDDAVYARARERARRRWRSRCARRGAARAARGGGRRRERPAPPPSRGPRRAARGSCASGSTTRSPRSSVGSPPPREEALAELAARYLAAYGPAEAHDLRAWSGLPAADVQDGVGGRARPGTGGATGTPARGVVRLLPAFDTYLLGYRERAVAPEHARRVWPGGGWIHPVVLVDGVAAGTWRRAGDVVEVDAFGELPALDGELEHLGRFLGRRLRLAAP